MAIAPVGVIGLLIVSRSALCCIYPFKADNMLCEYNQCIDIYSAISDCKWNGACLLIRQVYCCSNPLLLFMQLLPSTHSSQAWILRGSSKAGKRTAVTLVVNHGRVSLAQDRQWQQCEFEQAK
jgi:hypothetical protein